MKTTTGMLCAIALGIGALGVAAIAPSTPSPAWAQQAPVVEPIKVSVRRITESQYRHTIADVFGPDIAPEFVQTSAGQAGPGGTSRAGS